MRTTAKLATGTVMAFSAALVLTAPASAQRYGYYGQDYGTQQLSPEQLEQGRIANERNRAEAERELGANGYRGCDFSILTRNGTLNPNIPPNFVHDPITQKWEDPNDAGGALACMHQMQVNGQQQGYPAPRYNYRYGENSRRYR